LTTLSNLTLISIQNIDKGTGISLYAKKGIKIFELLKFMTLILKVCKSLRRVSKFNMIVLAKPKKNIGISGCSCR